MFVSTYSKYMLTKKKKEEKVKEESTKLSLNDHFLSKESKQTNRNMSAHSRDPINI